MWEDLKSSLGETLPSILGALAILVAGWVVALLIRAGMRKLLSMVGTNRRIEATTGSKLDVENGVATGTFFIVMMLVVIAFFNALKLELVSNTLQELVDRVLAFLPKLAAGAVLLLVAWALASILRTVVSKALAKTDLDEKLSRAAGAAPISNNVGNVVFWLVILLFLPGVLGALELQGLLEPVQNMMERFLATLPGVFAALVLGTVGWFLARVLRDLVTNLLTATGTDRVGERVGLSGTMTLSRLIGLIVYLLVFVPALIAALEALEIESISGPATQMLQALLGAIPKIIGAGLILAVAFFLAGFASNVLSSLLGGMGFDGLPAKLGLKNAFQGETTASVFVGKVAFFFIMLFAAVEAADQLGFSQVSDIVGMLIEFGGQVLLGVVIIGVGFWLSGLAHATLSRGAEASPWLAGLVRFSILGLVVAMGLRAMGLADDIVTLAFGLTLGAIAVAVALSFGLGGREAAGKQMEHWLRRARGESGKS